MRDNETPGSLSGPGAPQNASFSLGRPLTGGDGVRLSLDEVLDCLGWADGEFTAVCHKPVDGVFSSSVVKSIDAYARVNSLPEKVHVWFSVNPTAGPERDRSGRGNETAVTRWAGLCLDLDVKGGSFPDLDKAAEFIERISQLVGTRPSVVIFSGHGLQPIWPVEDGVLNEEVTAGKGVPAFSALRAIRRRCRVEGFQGLVGHCVGSGAGAEGSRNSELQRPWQPRRCVWPAW